MGQLDSLSMQVQSAIALGSAGYLPHYIGYNQMGRFDPNQQDGYLSLSFNLPLWTKNKWNLEVGADYILKPNIEESFFNEGYINLSWSEIALRLGKNDLTDTWYNHEIGSGNLFLSQNARNITKVGIGIWNFIPVPFIPFLEIKGAGTIGFLDRDQNSMEPLFHEKFVFLKTRNLPINPYVGLAHNVMFGGLDPMGIPLPSNFLDAFFARSAPNSGNPSDSTNATGAHFGTFDFGFTTKINGNILKVTIQQPISDNSGFANYFTISKDFVLGVNFEFENHPILKKFIYEHINTIHQSGEGLPDPIINGNYYTTGLLRQVEDLDGFLFDNFGILTNDISYAAFLDTIRDRTNFGYNWKGRDNHYNNDQYLEGNSYEGMVLGNPLFTTMNRFERATGETLREPNFIVNNRIIAHHFGLAFRLKEIDFTTWFTLTANYGTYTGKYSGRRFTWDYDPDYYFLNIAGMQYMGIRMKKKGKRNIDYEGTLALDLGDFGINTGIMGRITYRIR
jgi:hypothetical protein